MKRRFDKLMTILPILILILVIPNVESLEEKLDCGSSKEVTFENKKITFKIALDFYSVNSPIHNPMGSPDPEIACRQRAPYIVIDRRVSCNDRVCEGKGCWMDISNGEAIEPPYVHVEFIGSEYWDESKTAWTSTYRCTVFSGKFKGTASCYSCCGDGEINPGEMCEDDADCPDITTPYTGPNECNQCQCMITCSGGSGDETCNNEGDKDFSLSEPFNSPPSEDNKVYRIWGFVRKLIFPFSFS